jgi:hypothetical protein
MTTTVWRANWRPSKVERLLPEVLSLNDSSPPYRS